MQGLHGHNPGHKNEGCPGEGPVTSRSMARLTNGVLLHLGVSLREQLGATDRPSGTVPDDHLCRLAAVDDQGVPKDERGRVRTRPDNRGADLFGGSHTPDGLLRDHRLAAFWVATRRG